MSGIQQMFVGGGAAASTWNPADKGANISLSGGNLIAKGVTSQNSVRGIVSKNSGKWYFEITLSGTNVADLTCGMGIGTSAASLSAGTGTDAFGWAVLTANSTAYRLVTAFSTILISPTVTITAGDIINVAYDATNGFLDLGINGTYYTHSGSVAGSSPAGSSSSTFVLTGGTTVFPMASSDSAQQIVTLNTSPGSPPSGYAAWK